MILNSSGREERLTKREEVQSAQEEKRSDVNEVELRLIQCHSSKVPALIAFAERCQQTRCDNPVTVKRSNFHETVSQIGLEIIRQHFAGFRSQWSPKATMVSTGRMSWMRDLISSSVTVSCHVMALEFLFDIVMLANATQHRPPTVRCHFHPTLCKLSHILGRF
jgi:hypothetical protein